MPAPLLEPIATSLLTRPVVGVVGVGGGGGTTGTVRVLVAVGILIVVVLAFGVFVLHLRRRLLADDGPGAPPLPLDELRGMLKRGEISEQEYEAMRRRIIERMSSGPSPVSQKAGPAAIMPGALSGPPGAQPMPPRATARAAPDGTKRAPPGFDLTGEPLPRPKQEDNPHKPHP